jgi:hypothetical protein
MHTSHCGNTGGLQSHFEHDLISTCTLWRGRRLPANLLWKAARPSISGGAGAPLDGRGRIPVPGRGDPEYPGAPRG